MWTGHRIEELGSPKVEQVRRGIFNASSLATTTPTTWPNASSGVDNASFSSVRTSTRSRSAVGQYFTQVP